MKKYKVTVSNNLIEGRYRLPLVAAKLTDMMISKIKPEDHELPWFEISVKDYLSLTGNSKKGDVYKSIDEATNVLMKQIVKIKTADGGFEKFNWFHKIEYVPSKGMVRGRFHNDMKPMLLELMGTYTSYPLKNIARIKSEMSIRLYQILRQHLRSGKLNISIEELKDRLCIENEGAYKEFKAFKRAVVQRCVNEINSKTDILVDYEQTPPRPKKALGLKFLIHSQQLIKSDDDFREELEGMFLFNGVKKSLVKKAGKILSTSQLNKILNENIPPDMEAQYLTSYLGKALREHEERSQFDMLEDEPKTSLLDQCKDFLE